MRRGSLKVAAIGLAAMLAVSACGKDKDNSGSGSTGSTSASGAPSGDPVKLAFLWEKSGESQVGVDDFQNGAQLALDEINAAGGIDGRPVSAQRFAASPLDPQGTANAVLQAADTDPALIVGLIVSSQVGAAVSQIDRAGIPVVAIAQPGPDTVFGGTSSSELLWGVQPYMPDVVTAMVDYLVDDKDFTKVGLLGTNESFGQTGVTAAKDALKAKDLTPVAERLYAPDASDFSEIAVAMADAQVVVNWGYPNPLGAQIKQFAENGLNIPTYDGPSSAIVASAKLAPPAALETLSATIPCDAGDPQTQALKDMAAAYQAKYGQLPTYSAISAYDGVKVAAKAVEKAGNTEPDAINAALAEVEVTGACGDYKADEGHVMFHQSVLVDYAGDGSSKVTNTFTLPQVPKGG